MQNIENDDLEELQELGSGTFGTVYHGKWRGTDVAIKRIKSSCFSGRLSEQERLVGPHNLNDNVVQISRIIYLVYLSNLC